MKLHRPIAGAAAAFFAWNGPARLSSADEVQLLRDLNPFAERATAHVNQFAEAAGVVFFPGFDSEHGWELWASDGTATGTILVKDLTPGPKSTTISSLVSIGKAVVFSPSRQDQDWELWRSGGTPQDTVLLKTFPKNASGHPQALVESNGSLFFMESDGVSGVELWKSDGTPAGTMLVRDIEPGAGSSMWIGETKSFLAFNGLVFFRAYDAVHGSRFWRSDGTEAGTVPLDQLYPTQSSDDQLNRFGDGLYFLEGDRERAWRSDGTAQGTVLVFERGPSTTRDARFLGEVNGKVLFVAEAGLWTVDPAQGPPENIMNLLRTDSIGLTPFIWKNRLFFHMSSWEGSRKTLNLWATDGTPGGADLLGRIPHTLESIPESVFPVTLNGALYFAGEAPGSGVELLRTDGTLAGTRLVKDIFPGPQSSNPRSIASARGNLFFAGSDKEGRALWTSDGTVEGTLPLIGVLPGTDGSTCWPVVSFRGRAFLNLNDGIHGREPWESDGTLEGTRLLLDTYSDGYYTGPRSFLPSGGYLYFTQFHEQKGWQVFTTDGTTNGTFSFKSPSTGTYSDQPVLVADVQGTLFLLIPRESDRTIDLWKSDGTEQGTNFVAPLFSPGTLRDHEKFVGAGVVLGRACIFPVPRHEGGAYLWRSDGTPEGTFLLLGLGGVGRPAVLGSRVYFLRSGSGMVELWTSDGTRDGTHPVATLDSGGGSPTLRDSHMESLRDDLLILAFPGSTGRTLLWKSDGTAEGTTLIRGDIQIPSNVHPKQLVKFGSIIFFFVNEAADGVQLWATDGTSNRTGAVFDLFPATVRINPSLFSMVEAHGNLYFTVTRGLNPNDPSYAPPPTLSQQIWKTDGTPGGTVEVVSLPGEVEVAYVGPFIEETGKILFAARDPGHGLELWTLTPSGPAPLRGDANRDGARDLSDAVAMFDCLFQGGSCAVFTCSIDTNSDGTVDVADVISLLGHLFLGEPEPHPCE